MRLSVMVLGGPADSSAPRVALQLLEAAQSTGHALDTLFLYHKGAYAALNRHGDADEAHRWSQLAARSGIDCVVCQSALARVAAAGDAVPLPPFRAGGLGDWLLACERSDRVLRIGSLQP